MTDKRSEYVKYLNGKKICIVGPAPSILEIEPEQGQMIEEYDVIVRLNKALPIPTNLTKYLGTRTDVLYNCLNPEPESGGYIDISYLAEEIQWLISPYPRKPPFEKDIKNFERRNTEIIKFATFDLQWYNSIEKEIKTRPNTGILAILDLLSCEIEELYITGITFFKGGYIKEYRNYNEAEVLARMAAYGNHRQEPQIEFMKKILSSDPRVKMDKYLKEIIYE
jgi:hypothetical protein